MYGYNLNLSKVARDSTETTFRCDFSVVGYLYVDAVCEKASEKTEIGKNILFCSFSFFLLMKCLSQKLNRKAVQCKMFAGALEILTSIKHLSMFLSIFYVNVNLFKQLGFM
jgi:hypothetical protein